MAWTDIVSVVVVFDYPRSEKRLLVASRLFDLAFATVPSRLRSRHGIWDSFDQADTVLFDAVGHATEWSMAFFCRC